MFFWMQFPFIRIVLFLNFGILIVQNVDIAWKDGLIFFVSSCIVFLISRFFFNKIHILNRVFVGFSFLVTVISFGIAYTLTYSELHKPDPQLYENPRYYLAVITDEPELKGNNFRTVVEVIKVKDETSWNASSGKVLIYFPANAEFGALHYGDLMLVKGHPSVVSGPGNPEEFNYRNYLQNQNIYFQHFIKQDNYKLIKKGSVKNISYLVNKLRRNTIGIIDKYIEGKREKGIALALVLGVKNELEPEIKQAYASSGAMHVLAVSGLHVGMIYLVILRLFSRLKNYKRGRLLFVLISLSLLWLYALITGLPASVFRAVTMFSVIIISDAFKRQTNIYNSIAVAGVILLLYNPLFLYNVGFQLSFVAVIGIVYIFPKVYYLFYPDNKYIDYVWSLCCVAFAAQIATFPLGLYYFHQFPVYFFVSNLIVIPAAFVILSTGLCLLIFSFISGFGNVIGFLLGNFIWLVNEAIFKLQLLPYYLIEQVYLTSFQTILLYSFIFFFALFLHLKKFTPLVCAFFSVLIYSYLSVQQIYFQKNQNEIIFYNISNHSVVDFIAGTNKSTYSDFSDTLRESKINFHVQNYRIKKGLKAKENHISNPEISSDDPVYHKEENLEFVVWKGQKIIIVNEPLKSNEVIKSKINTRFLLLRNNSNVILKNILQRFNFERLIIDGSNSQKVVSKLEEEAEALNLNYHSTRKHGALIVDLTQRR